MNKNTNKRVSLCFKRWSRQNWSVFASMHKVVKIGVLSLGMSILTMPFNAALAQANKQEQDSIKTQTIKELKVVTQRANPTRGMVAPVQLYSRQQMVNLPLQTIETALKINPAVDLRERGAKGAQADISLYGGSPDQTMVMLNGVNFTDAQTGHQSHALPIDIEGVSGINLMGGVPGIGAFTGAVNITTAPQKPNYISAELSGGQYGYLYGNISGAIQKNGLSALVMGSIKKSDGYTQNTDFNRSNLFTYITYDSEKAGQFYFQAGYQKKYFGSNGFYSLAYPDQAEETETYLTSLRWKKQLSNNLSIGSVVSYRKNFDRFELFRGGDNAPSWYTGHNYHNTDNVGADLNLDYYWLAGTTSVGVDYTYNHIFSNVLGEEIEEKQVVPGEFDKYYTKAIDRSVLNGWVRHAVEIGKFNVAGSLNYAYSDYGNSFMWSLGGGYNITNNFNVDISAARSMRLPTFTDLYYTTSTHIGNTNLCPEEAITYRLGLNYNAKFKAYVSPYYRVGKNIIDWIKKDEDSKWESSQTTNLNTYGVELMLGYSFTNVLKDISFTYGYTQTDKSSGKYISKYALDYLKNKLALRAEVEIYKNLTLGVVGSWYERNGAYLDVNGDSVQYIPYWLLDARLNWKVNKFNFYIDANNILNAEYYDFGGLIQPGTWIVGGIKILI